MHPKPAMPGMLTRSKSLRFLKSNRKDSHQEDGHSMQPLKPFQTDFENYRSAAPNLRAEKKLTPPNLEVRPNTSGGPGDRTTMMFHMKTNPTSAFQSQEHVPPRSSPIHSTTTLATTKAIEEQGIIGIALGSPTMGSHWNSTPQATTSTTDFHPMSPSAQPNGSRPSVVGRQNPSKSKFSRWKSMFKKTAPPPPQESEKPSFYQLTQTVSAAAHRADSHHDDEPQASREPLNHVIEAMRTVSPPTYRSDIRASRRGAPEGFTIPQSPPERSRTRGRALTLGNSTTNSRPGAMIQRAFTTPNQPSGVKPNDGSAVPQLIISMTASDSLTTNTNTLDSAQKPLLDINIPDIKMDRYSVMFGNLLQSSSNRSSSLLVRRQVNADKLKPLTELSAKDGEQEVPMNYKFQRREASPTAPSASPRLSLFPSTSSSRAPSPLSQSVNRSRVVHRSRTAPAKSPLRQTFQTAEEKMKASNSATLKPTASPYLKPALTPTSIHSFESDSESITIVVAQATPFKVQLNEQELGWEICAKPLTIAKREATPASASPGLARTDSQRQPRVTKLSALSSHPSSAPLDAPSPLQRLQSLRSPPLSASRLGEKRTASETREKSREPEFKPTASVGLARSVSVSRANSPRVLKRTMTDIGNVASPDRLVERQVLTPTMVEVRNRKSQRVQVEMIA